MKFLENATFEAINTALSIEMENYRIEGRYTYSGTLNLVSCLLIPEEDMMKIITKIFI